MLTRFCTEQTSKKPKLEDETPTEEAAEPETTEDKTDDVGTKEETTEKEPEAETAPEVKTEDEDGKEPKEEQSEEEKRKDMHKKLMEEESKFDSCFMSFPEKLMSLLNSEEVKECMWWLNDGDSFCLEPAGFAEKVLDKHFQGTKFESFTRKLNRWYVVNLCFFRIFFRVANIYIPKGGLNVLLGKRSHPRPLLTTITISTRTSRSSSRI